MTIDKYTVEGRHQRNFWKKVDKSPHPKGCWIWTAGKDKDGYGVITQSSKMKKAHRVSYEWAKGPIPEGMQVLHSCDTPSCVNPEHLSVGTTQANQQDKMNKHREAKGEVQGSAKLTAEQVIAIREEYAAGGIGTRPLAKKFKIGRTQLVRIIRREDWKHIK